MRDSRRRVAVAIVLLIGAGIAAYLITRPDQPSDQSPAAREPADRPEQRDPAVDLTDEELIDQVLLLGFEGTDAEAPIVAELEQRQLGGVLVGTAN